MRKSRAKAIEQQESAESKDTLKLPHDPIGEAAIIASVIVSADARRRYLSLPSELFLGAGHAEAWQVLQQVFERGLTYDPVTVRQLSGGRVDPAVLDGYVAVRPELPPNLASFVDKLRWDAIRVAAAKEHLPPVLEALRDMTADPDRVRSLAKAFASSFDGAGSGRLRRSTAAILDDASRNLSKRRQGQAHFSYGFDGLDLYGPDDYAEPRRGEEQRCLGGTPRLIPGAAPGMVTIVAGATGSGKTTSVARMVLHWASLGQRTLWGAWEVRDHMNLELLATLSLGWSRSDVMTGQFTAAEQSELLAEMERLGEFVQFLDLPFDRKRGERGSNDRNLDLLQQEISDVDPDHFVADLFMRCLVQTKPEDVERAAWRFQAMMQEEEAHGVLVHQLLLKGEAVTARPEARPTLASLKGTTALVEAGDTVKAWYRPAFYKAVPDDVIECHVLKQRYGKYPQAVELKWEPEFGHIYGGRTIEVERPGDQSAADSFLDDAVRVGKGRGKRRRL